MMRVNRKFSGQVLPIEPVFRFLSMHSFRQMALMMIRPYTHLHGLAGCLIATLFVLPMGCDRSGTAAGDLEAVDWPNAEMAIADDSNVPPDLRERYREDAETLALRFLHESHGGKYEGIEIPNCLVDMHYYMLIHVYNATDLAARDSVVTIYEIHTPRFPATRRLSLGLDSSAVWIDAWHQGQLLTGKKEIDSLLVRYDLRLEYIYTSPLSGRETAYLMAGRPLNIAAVARLFEGIEGIRYAGQGTGAIGPVGKDITVEYLEDHCQLNYRYQWGAEYRCWIFNVYLDGRVEFVGSIGSTPP